MLSSREAYRLLDVGGTAIKCADGRSIPSRSGGTREQIAQALRLAVGETAALRGLGVAIPGPFDYREGIFRMDHKFAAVKGIPFRTLAGIPDGIPVRFLHDVNAVVAGAVRMLGLGGNTAVITLGTGLGFGFTVRGTVQANALGSPARSLYNLPCREGILEDYVSARGIRNLYAQETGDDQVSAQDIAERARMGDRFARDAFRTAGAVLGEYLPPLLRELGIDTLLFGGQVSRSFDLLEAPLRESLAGVPGLIHVGMVPEGAVFEGLATLFEND